MPTASCTLPTPLPIAPCMLPVLPDPPLLPLQLTANSPCLQAPHPSRSPLSQPLPSVARTLPVIFCLYARCPSSPTHSSLHPACSPLPTSPACTHLYYAGSPLSPTARLQPPHRAPRPFLQPPAPCLSCAGAFWRGAAGRVQDDFGWGQGAAGRRCCPLVPWPVTQHSLPALHSPLITG